MREMSKEITYISQNFDYRMMRTSHKKEEFYYQAKELNLLIVALL